MQFTQFPELQNMVVGVCFVDACFAALCVQSAAGDEILERKGVVKAE